MEGRALSFYSGGSRLAAVLYAPVGGPKPVPGIVLCQGYTGVKEMFLPILAERFAEAGFAALIFDYRGWGKSEGERGQLYPAEQVEDVRNAVTFLTLQDGVDPDRLGLYGTSLGGANAIYAAALDTRVRCVVASLAIGNANRWLRSLRAAWEWREFLRRVAADREERVRHGRSARVRAFDVVPLDPSMRDLMAAAAASGAFGGAEAEVSLESVEALLDFAPEEVVDRIAPRPLLLLHAAEDTLVPPDEAVALFRRAGEPKRLVLLPGVGHVDFYLGDALEAAIETSLSWFKQYLLSPGS